MTACNCTGACMRGGGCSFSIGGYVPGRYAPEVVVPLRAGEAWVTMKQIGKCSLCGGSVYRPSSTRRLVQGNRAWCSGCGAQEKLTELPVINMTKEPADG
jgi:hypothetical protein